MLFDWRTTAVRDGKEKRYLFVAPYLPRPLYSLFLCSSFAPYHNSVYCKWCSLHLHAASVSFAPLPSLAATVFQPSLICLSSWMRQDERTYWLPFNLVGKLNELSALSFCSCFLVFLPILLICCFSSVLLLLRPTSNLVNCFCVPLTLSYTIVKVRLDGAKGAWRKD